VTVNRDLVEQALRNLIANARRHASGRVIVEARAIAEHVEIEVRDDGPGVAYAERQRVFERFYRSGSRSAEGFGLGLPIARQAVEAVGGSIELLTAAEGGASVRVRLPSTRAEAS
jgi:signal transduction histidine kinase